MSSTFNPKAVPFTPSTQPTASTSTLPPPPPPPSSSRPTRISPVPPKPLVCKFFNTEKGCVQSCRFVHEAPGSVGPPNAGINSRNKPQRILELQERKGKGKGKATSSTAALPPATDSPSPPFVEKKQPTLPVCKFWQRGYCHRSTTCLFPHPAASTSSTGSENQNEPSEITCSVCFEGNPEFFGLLENCSHVFCLTCIREWRDPKKKETAQTNAKLCPLCRGKSDFITPSSRFVEEGEEKRTIIANYKEAMKQKPCRYFAESRTARPFCPYADSCFYAHTLPNSTTPFLFHSTVQTSMARHKSRRPPPGSNDPLRNFLGAGGRSIFPFGIGGPPGGGGLTGPGGLDWFLNSMENALLAEGGGAVDPTNTAVYLSQIFGRVLGIGEEAANGGGGGPPPLVSVNNRPIPTGVGAGLPRPRQQSEGDESDSSMPELVESHRRQPYPPFEPESATDTDSDSSPPPLIPIGARYRSTTTNAPRPAPVQRRPNNNANGNESSDSDGGPPPLVPARPPPSHNRNRDARRDSDSDSMPALVSLRAPRSQPSHQAPRAPTPAPRPRLPPPQDSDSDSDPMPELVPVGRPRPLFIAREPLQLPPQDQVSALPQARRDDDEEEEEDGPPPLVTTRESYQIPPQVLNLLHTGIEDEEEDDDDGPPPLVTTRESYQIPPQVSDDNDGRSPPSFGSRRQTNPNPPPTTSTSNPLPAADGPGISATFMGAAVRALAGGMFGVQNARMPDLSNVGTNVGFGSRRRPTTTTTTTTNNNGPASASPSSSNAPAAAAGSSGSGAAVNRRERRRLAREEQEREEEEEVPGLVEVEVGGMGGRVIDIGTGWELDELD